ncbi:hypothetical protein OH76DRAFT_1366006, partial [Lentinus brumalis]
DSHIELLSKMRPVNHSEDETDAEGSRRRSAANRFYRRDSRWMSTQLRTFLHRVDAVGKDDWERSPEKRSAGGNVPRTRVDRFPALSTDGTAAVGLWKNCYNQTYLSKLKPHLIRRLEIIDSDYDFRIKGDQPTNQAEFVQGSSKSRA